MNSTTNSILYVYATAVALASSALGAAASGSGQYYADYSKGICKDTPYKSWGSKYPTIALCCQHALFYIATCETDSAGKTPAPTSNPTKQPSKAPTSDPTSSPTTATPSDVPTSSLVPSKAGEFYADAQNDRCLQDGPCKTGVLPCHPVQDWVPTYLSIQQCCQQAVSWVRTEVCVANSGGQAFSGTNEWYMDWSLEKCVQDCPVSPSSDCGGLAQKWDPLHATEWACCDASFSAVTWRGNCPDGSSLSPSASLSDEPSSVPSVSPPKPSSSPSESPTKPSSSPSESPSNVPSTYPSESPSNVPSESPSNKPSSSPSESPSNVPSTYPSESPSNVPSESPSNKPSALPSLSLPPSSAPSETPPIWEQLGLGIDGEATSDRSGHSVSLSADGKRVAIGATSNDGANGVDSGHVRVYEFK
ncbi:hypothetical protein ACHAWC_001799 [Mediolabrus comicus]